MKNSLLIVDDDALVTKVYSTKFTDAGFDVLVAPTGALALKMVEESQPDVVLLDLQLPDLPGVQVLSQIRAKEALKTLPVIVFSSTYLTTAIQEAWKAGATKCLSKANCTPSQLVSIVKSVFLQKETAGAASPVVAALETLPSVESEPVADADRRLTASLQKKFMAGLANTLSTLRTRMQGLQRSADEKERSRNLEEMYRMMHALTNNASVAGMTPIAQFSDAVEALLRELYEKPRQLTPSTMRTVAHAVDFLGVLFSQPKLVAAPGEAAPKIMVVDDEPLSRRAVLYALEKARLKATSFTHPQQALEALTAGDYDLIFLDVDMPFMTGFDLCARLRALPKYKHTPVVFVTTLNDFESRAQSTISGGNDLIAKPFLFVELAVKALAHVLRNQINPATSAKPGVRQGTAR